MEHGAWPTLVGCGQQPGHRPGLRGSVDVVVQGKRRVGFPQRSLGAGLEGERPSVLVSVDRGAPRHHNRSQAVVLELAHQDVGGVPVGNGIDACPPEAEVLQVGQVEGRGVCQARQAGGVADVDLR